jgi:hypothetical protein
MATSKKATPNLPGSSRMQMPSGGGTLSGKIKEVGGMKKGGSKGGTTKKVMAMASKGGKMAKKGY